MQLLEFDGRLRVGRINIDEAQPIAQKFGVQSIPTFIVFSNGKEIRRVVGAIGADSLRKLAQQVL